MLPSQWRPGVFKALIARSALRVVKRRAAAAGIGRDFGCHSCRATRITAYLVHGGALERAAAIASHASTRKNRVHQAIVRGATACFGLDGEKASDPPTKPGRGGWAAAGARARRVSRTVEMLNEFVCPRPARHST